MRKTVGLPRCEMAEMTGHQKQEERARLWRQCRLFFLTPQTLVNDLENGACPAHEMICLVVDEAHKATGNHAYVQAVRLLTERSGGFRVLALSATPGRDPLMVQQVVNNLQISKVEARDEQSVDVVGYLCDRAVQVLRVPPSATYLGARDAVANVFGSRLRELQQSGVLGDSDPMRVRPFTLLEAQRRLNAAPPPTSRITCASTWSRSSRLRSNSRTASSSSAATAAVRGSITFCARWSPRRRRRAPRSGRGRWRTSTRPSYSHPTSSRRCYARSRCAPTASRIRR